MHLQVAPTHNIFIQRVLGQTHISCLCQGSHRAVEVCRPGEIQDGTGKFIVRHHYDVQPAMAAARPRQTTHAQVFLLLSVLLMAYQVISQKP